MKKITLESEGDFSFKFYIEKAIAKERTSTDGTEELLVEGVASTVNVDHDHERMAPDALMSMRDIINSDGVPLRIEHSKEDHAIVGSVYEAKVDDRNQLWVKARLDKKHPASSILHRSLKDGAKLGLSVGGRVKRAIQEFAEGQGKMVKTFYDIILDEVSVTTAPSNYDAWLFAKSVISKGESSDGFRDSGFYKEFLFQNQSMDYLQTISKSIPKESWHKVEQPLNKNNNDMKNDEKDETKEKAQDDTETKEKGMGDNDTEYEATKSVSRSEFNTLKNMVAKGFENMVGILSKAMDTNPKDTVNPNKDKIDPEEAEKAMDVEAHDQNHPDQDKTDPEANKNQDDSETKEKAQDDEDKEDTEKKKKSVDEGCTEDDVEMKSMSDAISMLSKLRKGMESSEEDETKEKAQDDDTETTEKSYKATDLDKFCVNVAQTLEKFAEVMKSSNTRYPGYERRIIEDIQNDPALQKTIQEWMKMPGVKKSVSMGVPYAVTKDGKRFALVATPVAESINKSTDTKGKTFKEVYQSNFSSVNAED